MRRVSQIVFMNGALLLQSKDGGYQLAQKLKFLKKKMIEWRMEGFGNIVERMNRLLAEFQSYDDKEEMGLLEEEDQINRKFCLKQFCKLILQDEIKWKQHSRNR